MSIKERLAKKTGDLSIATNFQSSSDHPDSQSGEVRQPKTGPGQMLAFRTHMQENNQRVQELQDQLKEFDGVVPVKLLDPKLIHPSKWANRHDTSFLNSEFALLKAEIEVSGVNVQPIRVRPHKSLPDNFEIIFGHRRHRACLELGISVSAIVEDVDDRVLFASMDRENRLREDLSPYEQGDMYRRALDDGLYPSLRQLAADLNVDPGNVSKAISIARLPKDVLLAFDSPIHIQYRWGQELTLAMQKDPDTVLARAQAIRLSSNKLPPSVVFDQLLAKSKPVKLLVREFKLAGKLVGKITKKTDGSVNLDMKAGVFDEIQFSAFIQQVENMIQSTTNIL